MRNKNAWGSFNKSIALPSRGIPGTAGGFLPRDCVFMAIYSWFNIRLYAANVRRRCFGDNRWQIAD
jgi:hypothetical protein